MPDQRNPATPTFPVTRARRFRVEHREAGAVSILGEMHGVPAHHATLAPFVSSLLHDGLGGELVLVDELSGLIVARRHVRPRMRKAKAGAG